MQFGISYPTYVRAWHDVKWFTTEFARRLPRNLEPGRVCTPPAAGSARGAIGVRSARTASNRPGQPLDSRLPARAGPLAQPDH